MRGRERDESVTRVSNTRHVRDMDHGSWLTFGRRRLSSLSDKTEFTETQGQSAPHHTCKEREG